ncbi:hypothetical protein [Flavobacterium sp. UBA7663]|uniref:hypothetical protein n=1 Tax=Flavobacterium sp. UBA7663 TaxID=1946557 RepID=UPI0025BFFF50|nr:hypothetical protein [Flavobacterium sp. UBA7663]
MNFKFLIIGFFIVNLALTSCLQRPRLTKKELSGFNVYKKNDTIIFQNLFTKDKDTTIITNKKKYRNYEPMIDMEVIFHHADIEYKNKNIKNPYRPETAYMYSLCKSSYNPVNALEFEYLYSDFYLDNNAETQSITLFLSDKKIENAYLLIYNKPQFSGANENSPNILYWDVNYGIVKYITFKGDIWERINW